MKSQILTTGLLAAGASALEKRACTATAEWPGFANVKHAFVLHDNWLPRISFNTSLEAPNPANPLGNPSYPGWTSCNGPNWVDYLTVKHNASLLYTYNLAYGGATVDANLVKPYADTVPTLKDQVQTLFSNAYAAKTAPAWTGSDSVFAFWIGVNDIGNSYWNGADATSALNTKIVDVYQGLARELYEAGARNFVWLTTPPVDRTPMLLAENADAQKLCKDDVADFNGRVNAMAKNVTTWEGANSWVVDANGVFNGVLDNVAKFDATKGYKNTTGYCDAYKDGTTAQDTLIDSCTYPVNQYFWLNTLHPTYPIHDAVAETVALALEAGPNVC
ncbi:fungal cellulose binding domain-containing protein [Colletotrichum costaricense]|uniref:Fungal cellulose binding domain-containing protein n=1 Tax=Colletotrichum costaricense TaxID=1209916 RepID=A0AAI9YMB1_9PEZI|nr:fungal cellulose binding domain-containing protein [Colletotrichum costaricense]KAK1515830.1 fungal cellulose binding domain-containing protein [Colletotrichum costaricense]